MAFRGDEGRGQAAKIFGELLSSIDPEVSEWGNPTVRSTRKGGKPGELKHLSNLRKRNQ